jgi:hypothetical protein
VLPIVSTMAKQTVLDQLSDRLVPNTHALLPIDRAGWHCPKALVIRAKSLL